MADQRCPMCGKPNPAEADACRFCGARLKPVLGGTKRPTAPPQQQPPSGGDAEWMSDLRGDMMRNRPKTSMLPPEPPAPASSDDWLNRIESRGESKAPASGPAPRRPAPPGPVPPEKPDSAPEPPAWLSKVRDQVSSERVSPAPPESEAGEDPVWLKRLRARRTQEEIRTSEPSPEPAEEPAAPGELPDWLSKLREKSKDESGGEEKNYFESAADAGPGASPWGEPAPPQKPSAGPDNEEPPVPDWMRYPSPAAGSTGPEPPVGSEDWIGSISSAIAETPPTPAKPGPVPPQGRPPTSSLLGGGRPANPETPAADQGGIQGKTGRIMPAASPFSEPIPPGGAAPAPFGSDWEFPTGDSPDFPFPNPAGEPPATPSAFGAGMEPIVPPGGTEETPDWLADAQQTATAPEPETEAAPPIPTPDLNELLRPDSMPDWLKKPSGAEPVGKEFGPGKPSGATPPDNLEQGELPRWLEAMRPIQSVAVPTEDEERVESVGPLAGLRGVLSAEPVVAMPHRPGIMAGNIDASPAQMALTETLRRLLIEPEVRAARKPVRAMLLTPVIRKIMSGVLLLAILLPMLTGPIFSNAAYQPQTGMLAGQLVSALPPDRTVLMAFEYDASSAPEIETGATVLLEHLAQRGIQVVFISSQPNGTMLGEGLRQYNEKMGMSMPAVAADFGYIPGGAGGLRRLGGNLREVIQNPDLDWSAGPLAAIRGISDFSMIILLAAGPQSVRDWVEQVHTASPATPIIAMVSAASDALVFPYTEGSQPAIRGLITGYSGAQAYRVNYLPATVPADGVMAMRWQAYGSGILAILLTLGAGVIASLILGFVRRDRKAAE
jgi:hypothetical protein